MAASTSYSTSVASDGTSTAVIGYVVSVAETNLQGRPSAVTSTISTFTQTPSAAVNPTASSSIASSTTPAATAGAPVTGSASSSSTIIADTSTLINTSTLANGTVAISTQVSTSAATVPIVTPHSGLVSFTTTITPTAATPTAVTFIGRVSEKSQSIGGPVAGGVIGGLVAGAIIGALIMLVVGKKKNRKSPSSRVSTYANEPTGHGPVQTVANNPKEKAVVSTAATDPDYLLPQPKDDQSMGTDANKLFVQISNHVENFYHNNSLRDNITPQSDEENLLISRKTRHFAIKRLICRDMLTAMAWDCKPETSLLPAAAVAMAHNMSRANLDQSTYEVAWSRWRVSTALLLTKDDGPQKAQARKFWVDRLLQKLQPFQIDDPETLAMIKEDLHAICKLAENLASLICSQPGRWEFVWPRTDAREHMVIFPELVRTTDSKGRGLERPRRPLEAQRMQ